MHHSENYFRSGNTLPSSEKIAYELHAQMGREQRQTLLRGRRSLILSQCLIEEELDWQKLTTQKLTHFINERSDPVVLLGVLFRLMRSNDWRRWSAVMQLLLQKLQNLIAADSSVVVVLSRTEQFQQQLEYLCDLACPNLQRHYLALLATLLKFNRLHLTIDEARLTQRMVGIARRFPALAAWVFWIVASHEYTHVLVEKALDCDFSREAALPLLSILANFVVKANPQQALKLLHSEKLRLLTFKACDNASSYEVVRELQLLYNNFMSKSISCFGAICQSLSLLERLLSFDTEETWMTIYILHEAALNGFFTVFSPEALSQKSQSLKSPCPENLQGNNSAVNRQY